MRPQERQSGIADLVRQHGRISVDELVSRFNASAETIRRDLAVLSADGRIQRIHGGAAMPRHSGESPMQLRRQQHVAAKRKLARKACALISPGDSLFIDTGTTTSAFAEELGEIDDLTVVTNSLEIAGILGSSRRGAAKVYLLGGQFVVENSQTVGELVINQLNNFRTRHAVITVGAVDHKAGLTDFDFDEAQIARCMIDRAKNVIILADSTKFDQVADFEVGTFARINCLVSNQPPQSAIQQSLQRDNVQLVC